MCPDSNDVKERILDMPAEDIPRHKLRWGHVFEWSFGKDLASHLSLR